MEKRFGKNVAATMLASVLLTASAVLLVADSDDQFSDWSAAVNHGVPPNSTFAEFSPAISKDGLSLYFQSNRPGGFGGVDIWIAQRPSVGAPWGTPQNLGPTINTSFTEAGPALSLDGHRLFFHSDRPGGFGGQDLYVSRRHNKRDDLGWQPAENLGSGVNAAANEMQPSHFEDDASGVISVYFISDRPGGLGGNDIYASTLQSDEIFGTATLVAELSSPFGDAGPVIRRDGLEMFLPSDRPGTLGSTDIWVSTRPSTSDPWSTPVNLGPAVNTAALDSSPELSFDGTALYFISNRPGGFGGFDLYVSTRTKLSDEDDD